MSGLHETLPLAPLSPLVGEMSRKCVTGRRQVRYGRLTPLCRLRRHLPLKGGEGRKPVAYGPRALSPLEVKP
ncbi:hypothetical protein C8N35_101459 [Breoghania corrubedonensis]|uniref:Uncharacterized protein n=1 Tax=Breoghania corrubedonensis TaxID=665038 RepID=A0A2T5VFB9_9HYPH|nr:hypothetical protein C8N35_101459 [Breoghania corrubedonensis]